VFRRIYIVPVILDERASASAVGDPAPRLGEAVKIPLAAVHFEPAALLALDPRRTRPNAASSGEDDEVGSF
jgi:hypothetical protein